MQLVLIKGNKFEKDKQLNQIKSLHQKFSALQNLIDSLVQQCGETDFEELNEAISILRYNGIQLLKINKELIRKTDLEIMNETRKEKPNNFLKVINHNEDFVF